MVSGSKNATVFWHKGSVSLFESESSQKLLEENCIEVTLLCPPTLFSGLTMAQLSQQLNQNRTKNPLSGPAVMQNHCKIVSIQKILIKYRQIVKFSRKRLMIFGGL